MRECAAMVRPRQNQKNVSNLSQIRDSQALESERIDSSLLRSRLTGGPTRRMTMKQFPRLPITTRAPYVSMRRLRRAATRALRLAKKHASRNRTLAAVAETLVPVAELFVDLYDHDPALIRGTKLEQGHAHVEILRQTARTWLALVERDLPIDPDKYPLGPVPDDVFAAAKMLVETLQDAHAKSPLAYADSAIDELKALLATADAAWTEARAVHGAIQERKQQLRQTAMALQAELVTFRRVLRVVLGSRHADYQAMRASRGSGPDGENEQIVDDDEVVGDEAEVDEADDEAEVDEADEEAQVDEGGSRSEDESSDVDAARNTTPSDVKPA